MMLLFNFVRFFFSIIYVILNVYMWVIIIKALLSWVNPDPYNSIVRFINDITEPVLRRLRVIIPIGMSALDLSPLIVIALIWLISTSLRFAEYDYILPLIAVGR